MEIRLTPEQSELLKEVLQAALGDLNYEIADTDRSDYKEKLRRRREVLRGLLEAVESPPASAR